MNWDTPLIAEDIAECDQCGCAVKNSISSMKIHDRWHARLENFEREVSRGPDPRLFGNNDYTR